jgi:hypothetical protein
MTYVYQINPKKKRNLFGSLSFNTIFIIINVVAFIIFTILISLKVLSIDSVAIKP